MTETLQPKVSKQSIPLTLITEKEFPQWLKRQPARVKKWLEANHFKAAAGSSCVLPDASGKPARVAVGISSPPSLWDLGSLPGKLPAGTYTIDWNGPLAFHEWLALGWALGAYQFTRYKKGKKLSAHLAVTKGSDFAKIQRYADSIILARDLINTPSEDMGPEELATAIAAIGKKYGAKVSVITGNDLLKKNYPAIHTVGRASVRAPRLIDLTWGNPKHPHIALVGKGVCFDTGGLDIKNSASMYLMKKDMAGAACALATARMVMDAKLPVYLRLLVPAVENSVAGNAFRPSDVITMRNGLTVEVGNTDAEGRLILADALAEAATKKPKMIFDFSTLTGAARVAVGTDLAALFCNDEKMADRLLQAGHDMEDPLWRLPLYAPYKKMLDSSVADLNSAPNSAYAGAITAALFLEQFVPAKQPWAHLDFMAWNGTTRAGRPEGGEAMAVRAVYRLIEQQVRNA
ncbi:MAG: leucyl aminopeptidase family protein [Alphaproteobacteria bacterium]